MFGETILVVFVEVNFFSNDYSHKGKNFTVFALQIIQCFMDDTFCFSREDLGILV